MTLQALDAKSAGDGFGLSNYDKLQANFDYLIANPPPAEMAYVAVNSDGPTGVSSSGSGDLLATFPAATLENRKHYFELNVNDLFCTGGALPANIEFALYEDTTQVISFQPVAARDLASGPMQVTIRMPFTPSAGSHTYTVRWLATNGNTWEFFNLVGRIVRA